MKKIVAFIQNALCMNDSNDRRVGLAQFKDEQDDFSINQGSIRSKDVKLSDLLRRG